MTGTHVATVVKENMCDCCCSVFFVQHTRALMHPIQEQIKFVIWDLTCNAPFSLVRLLLLRFFCAASRSIGATHPRVNLICPLGSDL
jgi:hypothetical protein